MKIKTKNKIKHKLTKKKIIKKMRGGVDSDTPTTKSVKKIQATARARSTRQTKKAKDFNELLSSGASKYKKSISTLDLKGINLKGAVLSKRVLNGIDLQKVDFTNATLNGTKLSQANLSGSIFKSVLMKNSDLTNSICKNCIFMNSNLNLSLFNDANLEGSTFENVQLFGTNFSNANLSGSTFSIISLGYDGKPSRPTNFKGANLNNCKVNSMLFFENQFLNNTEKVYFDNIRLTPLNSSNIAISRNGLSNIDFKNSSFERWQILAGQQLITNLSFDNCKFTNFIGHSNNYKNISFSNSTMEKSDFRSSIIDTVYFTKSNLKGTSFSGAVFKIFIDTINSDMTQCNFSYAKGLQGQTFTKTNFTSASFNGTPLIGTYFLECNLQGAQFIPIVPVGARGDFDHIPSDLTNAVFVDCKLQSITFQNTLGLQGRNFEGKDLRRCTFAGCDLTGTIFRDCNLSECVFTNAFITDTDFTGSNRENTVFDGAIGRAENETLTPEERGIEVQDDGNDIPAIYPTDVHQAFKLIKKNDFYNAITSYINGWQSVETKFSNMENNSFIKNILELFLDTVINNINSNNKNQLINYKNRCIDERLKYYNYKDNIVTGSNPRISWLLFLAATITYVENQIPEFYELYVTDIIMESATTYGEGGLSCDRGINERFIIKLRNTMYMMMDLPEIKNNIDKVIEFNTILNTLDPTKTLPTTKEAIEAEKTKPEKEYIDFTVTQELRDEWYDIHGSSGSEPFDDGTTIDDAIVSYEEFLKDKFDYDKLDAEDKERYNREMREETNNMRKLLDEGAGMTYLFLGGRKITGGCYGCPGIWGMGGSKFRLLCRKIFGKTKCKKMRNTKKLKKLKIKRTRKGGMSS